MLPLGVAMAAAVSVAAGAPAARPTDASSPSRPSDSAAEAATPPDALGASATAAELPAPHRLRGGVVVGVSVGGGPFGASGYPNDVTKIGDSNDYSASGWMAGPSGSIFVLGALSDYVSFGFWYTRAGAESARWRSTGDGGGLRVEAFPLVGLLPRLGGLGLLAQFGIGGGSLTSKTPGLPRAEGTQSIAGAGVFWEWSLGRFLGGHVSLGPSLEFDAIFTQSFEDHGLVVGGRLAFYGGP